ncbi:FMN reductase [Acinetobacter junii]|jgi:FMN reductase|uniref:FMN reductase n=3 Tax=Acinetobacter junii TaxID=40215 RepID=A0AAX1MI91_ACIJU|nr:FMN reductase [Acinetobacter junii]ATU44121.1 FMN reductase [Acinetobacter junii]EEY92568.1 FMN reductase [Acinetobacter junii SH205]ENV51280.1 FMN reductase [Acinetobacter junii CIP 107470 = MTCC 11364]EPR86387.1 FMN reductase [Acinetobacter junii CIP 107470 = MTCC 11364]MBJ8440345.1 FMN reductase [Acinetobacter junii]
MSHQNNLSTPLNIVAVSGGLNSPSKTESLVQAILDELAEATQINVHFIKLSEIGPLLGGAIYRNQLPQRVQDDLAAVEAADALIVGTPVYRASFTGLFKHFFDFVEQTALVDVPVLLAASGGSDRHALVLEHQLRPLFSFFQAQTLPIGVYATDRDFTPEYTVKSEQLADRVTLAVARALPILEWAPAKGKRAEVIKAKTEQANQNLGINKQIEQAEVLPSAAVPDLDAAESRLHQKSNKNLTQVA